MLRLINFCAFSLQTVDLYIRAIFNGCDNVVVSIVHGSNLGRVYVDILSMHLLFGF